MQLPPRVDSLSLYRRARTRGISVIPGPAFSSGLGKFQDCLRLSCGAPFNRIMDKALETLGKETKALA